jgi:hypothetical protein
VVAIKIIPGREFDLYALEHNGRRELLDFLVELRASANAEFLKLLRAFDRTAACGLMKNEQRFKRLTPDIYEFKTFGGVRVLCFREGRSIIILTNGFKKKKKYDDEIVKAKHLRSAFLTAKTDGCLSFTVESLL